MLSYLLYLDHSFRVQFNLVYLPLFLLPQASLVMYELAWKMSRDNNDLLWWAIIGLTEQLLYERINR